MVSSAEFRKALSTLNREGRITEKRLKMLRVHFGAPNRTLTWEQLGSKVNLTQSSVHLHYGKFARLLAEELGYSEPPHGFWLYFLADWAEKPGPKSYTAFTMRPELADALKALGWTS
jgi:hypothetical protein